MIPVSKAMRQTGGNYTGDDDNLYSARPTVPPVTTNQKAWELANKYAPSSPAMAKDIHDACLEFGAWFLEALLNSSYCKSQCFKEKENRL